MDFCEAVRSARLQMGVSVAQLAAEVSLSPSFLEKIERGASKPPSHDSKVREIANVLMVDEDEFVSLARDARKSCLWQGSTPLFDRCRRIREDEGVALW